jgi:hypothetical protein
MTQADRILAYLRDHGSITPLEAMRDLGCYRLAARIYDLRAAGHEIHDEPHRVTTRWGTTTTVSRYSLATNLPPTRTTWDADGRGLLPL